MKKNSIILIFILLFNFLSFAQTVPQKVAKGEESWRYLKQAEGFFEAADYGNAFSYAEKAKQIKKNDCDWQVYQLESLMKKSRIRRIGTQLDLFMRELQSLNMNVQLDIINYHLEKKGHEYFKNDYNLVFDYVSNYFQYPEADFLMAKIYFLEGENEIALNYLANAYKNYRYLDVPLQKYDILNEMAKISFTMQNYDDYEKYLLLIVADNEFYNDQNFMNAIIHLIDDKTDSLEKFFLLYRCQNLVGLSSLIELSEYYRDFGYAEKALKCSALASIIAVTRIDDVLKQRIRTYEYKNLSTLLVLSSNYSDIVDWGNENNIWKLFYDFADIAALNGKLIFAKNLYTILAQDVPEDYWKVMSEQKLIK